MGLQDIQLGGDANARTADPLRLFEGLTLRRPIENIWQPQAEALNAWHIARSVPDVVVQMNTGGGKTLVGLIAAQSLVNETGAHVLYVCANNQLVEQTLERAAELSLSPAAKYKTQWLQRHVYDSADSFCVTNYQTVFNGLSTIQTPEVKAVVFDDAHVAENHIRGSYTLRLRRDHDAFRPLLELLKRHLKNGPFASTLQDLLESRPNALLYVPTFITWSERSKIRRLLLDHGVAEHPNLKFPWAHLKDRLHSCCLIVSSSRIEFAPPILPLAGLPVFQSSVRRLFLTATLPGRDSLARTFGLANPHVITPSGKSGDPQRLFMFAHGQTWIEQRDNAVDVATPYKSCVIAASEIGARRWSPPGEQYDGETGQRGIDAFKARMDNAMLVLAGRYDGIDLPGQACRVLILDSMPVGEHLLEQFLEGSLAVSAERGTRRATRIIQAIGRIFRSNTDHGVVVLVGPDLQAWVRTPSHHGFFPKLVQQQLLFAVELAKSIEKGQATPQDVIRDMLDGTRTWDNLYHRNISRYDIKALPGAEGWYVEALLRERAAFMRLWDNQPRDAASAYHQLAESVTVSEPRLAAWYKHWEGLSLLSANDEAAAGTAFIAAAGIRAELGRPKGLNSALPRSELKASAQALVLAQNHDRVRARYLDDFARIKKDLVLGPNTSKAEEAAKNLGAYLGLAVDRPDKRDRKGPDIVWRDAGAREVRGMELKTDKSVPGKYTKDDVAQCHDHEQWLRNEFPDSHSALAIVGPLLPVVDAANPGATLSIVDPAHLCEIAGRAEGMINAVTSDTEGDLPQRYEYWLTYYQLKWPLCWEALPARFAVDLQGPQD